MKDKKYDPNINKKKFIIITTTITINMGRVHGIGRISNPTPGEL